MFWQSFITQSLAVWLVSTTISRAVIFKGVRTWVTRRSAMAGEGISCQYCISHWLGVVTLLVPCPLVIGRIGSDSLEYCATRVIWWAAIVGGANVIGRTVARADDATKREAALHDK